MSRLLCWLLGHDPRGPINTSKDNPVYQCNRCLNVIKFDKDRGWLLYHD